jgi:hypothetical protein
MPSKHKKKSKDRNSAPQKAPVRKTLQDLDREAKELSQEWKISPQKRSLDEQVRHLLLTQRNISIDNALCLGLGSIEMAPHWSLPGRTKANQRVKDSMPVDWQDSIDPDDAPSTFPPVADGRKRNISLYQLLVFETVLSCLRMSPKVSPLNYVLTRVGEKFTISSVRFQDPRFTKTDQEFLKQRGHIVLDWDTTIPEVGGGYKMDPRLSDIISRSTMCYLPYLDSPTIVEVICAVKPSLYLGSELISNVIRRFFVCLSFPVG